MWIRWLALAAVLACGASLRADEPFDLKVLYAGEPGSDREKDFVSHLGMHFTKVGKAAYQRFTEDQAKGYDVVIFDWGWIYPRDKSGKIDTQSSSLNLPSAPALSQRYDRPTILVGAAGGILGMSVRLKIDWL
jgi:hypothetical protein